MSTSLPISAEAKGRLRLMFAELAASAAAVTRAVAAIPAPMASAAVRPGVGSTPAVNRIIARLPASLVARGPRRAVWRFIAPSVGPGPPALIVRCVLLGSPGKPPLTVEDFGLLATQHSLARSIDRSGGLADPIVEMLDAHNYLLALPSEDGEQLFQQLDNIVLPGRRGLFLVEPQSRTGRSSPMAICKTWIGCDQFAEQQSRDAAAWAELRATL